jgi:hypothetical protein
VRSTDRGHELLELLELDNGNEPVAVKVGLVEAVVGLLDGHALLLGNLGGSGGVVGGYGVGLATLALDDVSDEPMMFWQTALYSTSSPSSMATACANAGAAAASTMASMAANSITFFINSSHIALPLRTAFFHLQPLMSTPFPVFLMIFFKFLNNQGRLSDYVSQACATPGSWYRACG